MATHDYIISNASGAAVRADLNNALAAIVTNNSSATAPTTTYAYQWWADTGSSPTVMKLRNAANSAWITLFQLDGEWSLIPFENGTAAAPSIYFKDSGTDTGIYSPGADQVAITTGGTARLYVGSTGSVGIGTTPESIFHVKVATNENIRFTGGSGDTRIACFNDATSATTQLSIQGSPLLFRSTGGLEAARIDTSSRLLVGTSSATNNLRLDEKFAVVGTSASYPGMALTGYTGTASDYCPLFEIQRSRGTTDGSYTKVENGDCLGKIMFRGADGSSWANGAYIEAYADAATGAGDLPTRLVFSTTADGASSPTERMRITNGGITSTFTTAGNASLWVANGSAAGTSVQLIYGAHSAGGVIGGTNSFTVWTNGNVQNTNGSYTTLSDAKLKENIVDAGSQWDDVKAVRIRKWNFKAETGHETHRQIGPIAQELETVCPGLVFETPDRDKDGNETGEVTKGVNQSVLYMKAVKALQEAMERIEQLEAKVAALESA